MKDRCKAVIKNRGFATGYYVYYQVYSYILLLYLSCCCRSSIDVVSCGCWWAALGGRADTFGANLVRS